MKQLAKLLVLSVASMACIAIGCVDRGGIANDFQDEDPKVRIAAIRRAGREKLHDATPYLVDRLTDSEAEVRMFAIVALEEITGLTHNYRHFDSTEQRFKAVKKWREWLADR